MESQRGPMDWKLGFSRQIGTPTSSATPTSATPSPRPSDPPPMAVEGANPQRLALGQSYRKQTISGCWALGLRQI